MAWKCNVTGDALFIFSYKLKGVRICTESWAKTDALVDAEIYDARISSTMCRLA